MNGSISVLHVDDEAGFAEMTATFLEREDDRLEVETATSADEGLDLLDDAEYQCVVSDYDMPGRNGIEFLCRIRERWVDLPVILFTGKGNEEIASEAISAGVTDYLQKGSGTDQYEILANRVTNAVSKLRAERQVEEERRRFRTLFDRLSQPTVEVEYEAGEPIVERVNPAFEETFGYDVDEIVGDSLDAYIVPEDRTQGAKRINRHVQDGGRLHSEAVTRRTADGLRRFLLQNAVYDDGSGGFAIYSDITEREEIEDPER
ncbi:MULTISPECIES: response regulator [Haloferacaceae]|uniref:Response regulator n=1 Tax=Halorubrum glutamatedens TaxID=2707018 RepID=A0ABD5QRH3_9EURY|nr:response regulator [Halobellus captivus]